MKKKILAMCLVVALLATAIVGATLAYFTDTEAVKNTFTVGDIDITLVETDMTERNDGTVGLDYHLFPGQTYKKDPTVTVEEGSEKCYVRMIVTISNQRELDAVFAPDGGIALDSILTGYDSAVWKLMSEKEEGNSRIYEFWYVKDGGVVDAAAGDVVLPALFTGIEVPEELDNEDMEAFDNLTIDIEAHAIQTETFADAEAAWLAFGT